MTMSFIFCQIVARQSPASFVYEDDAVAAFMTLQPTAPGECLIIPKAHIDHFTDVPDDIAQRIMLVAQLDENARKLAFNYPES